MFIIKEGTFTKHVIDETGIPIVLSILSRGEMIGITEILSGSTHFSIELRCESAEGALYFLPREELLKYLKNKKQKYKIEGLKKSTEFFTELQKVRA